MSREYWVMAALAVASILSLTVLGRSDKPRESLFLFIATQVVSWPSTILFVFMGLFRSPVRLFPKATEANFLLAYVLIPALFVAYYWHYPRNERRILQIAYTLAFTGGAALLHVALQKYTDLLLYINFSGYMAWLVVAVTYYVVRIYSDWYFSQLTKARSSNPR